MHFPPSLSLSPLHCLLLVIRITGPASNYCKSWPVKLPLSYINEVCVDKERNETGCIKRIHQPAEVLHIFWFMETCVPQMHVSMINVFFLPVCYHLDTACCVCRRPSLQWITQMDILIFLSNKIFHYSEAQCFVLGSFQVHKTLLLRLC